MRAVTKILLVLAGGLLLTPVLGHAQTIITFDITAIGASYSASGTFTADPLSDGAYQIISIDGTLDGQSMTLLPPGTYWGPSDNLLFTDGASLDYGGIAFSAGGNDYNLYDYHGDNYLCTVAPHTCGNTPVEPENYPVDFTWSVTSPVPEPSGLVLLGTGLLVLALLERRKLLALLHPQPSIARRDN